MSASEESLDEIMIDPPITIARLGIIAGAGQAPRILAESCERQGIEPFLIGFSSQTDSSLMEGRDHLWSNLGAVGSIIKAFKDRGITDLVFIGAIKRPSLSSIKPDIKTAAFLAKVGLKAMGDNDLLSAVRAFLHEEGFTMHGVHKFAEELLTPEGLLTRRQPTDGDHIDIERGLQVSQMLGAADVGQSVIVQEGLVLSVEAIEGTDALIKRTVDLKRSGRGGILVKTCKPQQDTDMDLPTIGTNTIEQAAACGLSGIVLQAGRSLILERESVITLANKHKLFILGVSL